MVTQDQGGESSVVRSLPKFLQRLVLGKPSTRRFAINDDTAKNKLGEKQENDKENSGLDPVAKIDGPKCEEMK